MKNVNKVFLLGHVGAIESREVTDGALVSNFSVATNMRWKDRDEQVVESVEWHRCEAWNKVAELVIGLLKVGSPVHIEGRLRTKKWTDAEGTDRYSTSILVEEFSALESREPPAPAPAPVPARGSLKARPVKA